jgi:hypothetical protein
MNWNRMSSTTSPYLFSKKEDMDILYDLIEKNKYAMFLRKIDKKFPDELLEKILFYSLTFTFMIT